MVYCSKCGTLNPDSASVCSNCGAPLQVTRSESSPYMSRRQWREERLEYHRRNGAFSALAIGLVIILIGFGVLLQETYGVNIYFGPLLVIVIGVLIIIAGLRARSYWKRKS